MSFYWDDILGPKHDKKMQRMTINQPSEAQIHHKLHGVRVLAENSHGGTVRIYFLSGNTISMEISKACLSDGWKPAPSKLDNVIAPSPSILDAKPQGENPKDAVGSLKAPITTVPINVMAEVGVAMMEGGKYGFYNYRVSPVRASVYIDACWRHAYVGFWEGEDIDPDSQLHHVTKAIASLVVLRAAILQGTWYDDRPIRPPQDFRARLNDATKWLKEKLTFKPPFLEKDRESK